MPSGTMYCNKCHKTVVVGVPCYVSDECDDYWMWMVPGPEEINHQSIETERKYVNLVEAVRDLYYAAYWSADRYMDEENLWARVRAAAGLEEGLTKSVLGKRRK